MPMTPGEMLHALDAAIAVPRRERRTALTLTAPHVLGETGRRVRATGAYAYTRAQCQRMRDVLLAAAAAADQEAQQAPPVNHPYTGDAQ